MGLEVFLVIVCLVVAALAAVGATARCSSAARHREALSSWEKGWLSPFALIEESDSAFGRGMSLSGTWTGSFSYNDILKSSVKLEDGQFTAELSQEGKVIAGHISDALGEASILGVIEYPDVRFAKSYEASNSTSWRVGSHLGKIYYEGRVSADGESMTGEWFQFPFDRSAYAGSWRMVVEGREAHESGLVPRKIEAADGSVLVPLKPKAADGAVLVPRKTEAAAPAPAPEAIALEAMVETGSRSSTDSLGSSKIICPHCQTETPGSFDFCLYCSKCLV